MAGVTERCEVQTSAGEETIEDGGPVLHPPEPGLLSWARIWLRDGQRHPDVQFRVLTGEKLCTKAGP
jgi:hypothetical protein